MRDTMAGLYFPPLKEQLSNKLLGEGRQHAPAMLDTARFLVELGDLKQTEVPPSFKPFINTYTGKCSSLIGAQGGGRAPDLSTAYTY